jgi:hypothetical protein
VSQFAGSSYIVSEYVSDKKENNILLRTTEGDIGARRKPIYGARISRDNISFVLDNKMS